MPRRRTSRSPSAAATPKSAAKSAAKPAGASARKPKPSAESVSLFLVAFAAKWVAALIVVCGAAYALVYFNAPELACDKPMGPAWFVRSIIGGNKTETLREVKDCVRAYDDAHPRWAVTVYILLYVCMQTFAIPGGPLFLSLLTGALWPYHKSLFIISLCATGGASGCYLLSKALRLGSVFEAVLDAQFDAFQKRVANESLSGNLLYYMLFLRLTPLMPNWFINLVSPHAGVPLETFALATAVGLVPANSLHYASGSAVANAVEDTNSLGRNLVVFTVLQLLALLPTFFKGKLEEMDRSKAA